MNSIDRKLERDRERAKTIFKFQYLLDLRLEHIDHDLPLDYDIKLEARHKRLHPEESKLKKRFREFLKGD